MYLFLQDAQLALRLCSVLLLPYMFVCIRVYVYVLELGVRTPVCTVCVSAYMLLIVILVCVDVCTVDLILFVWTCSCIVGGAVHEMVGHRYT